MVVSLDTRRSQRSPATLLSTLDWSVVEAGRTDGALSLNPDGLRAGLARRLLGIFVPQGLADPRLEALRRFAVRAWHWDVIRDKDLRAFMAAGYNRAHVLEILSHVGMARGFTPSIEYVSEPLVRRGKHHPRVCG